MELKAIESPLISRAFYERLISVFRPIAYNDITIDTNIIDIQRRAAQQEVIEYIRRNVHKDYSSIVPLPKWKSKLIEYILRR